MIKQMLPRLGQRGSLIVTVLAMMVILTVIGLSIMSFVSSQYDLTVKDTFNANATSVAEAGAEMSLYSLNSNPSFTGYTTEQQLFNDPSQGRGTYTATVTNASDGNSKTITTVGKVYRYGTGGDLVSTRRVKITTVGTGSPGYAVHTGPGGLILSGSANITNADVYVNGYINMSGTAKIGTTSQPLSVNVANDQCPTGASPGPTYPTVCTTGNPITMAYSTFIYGTVCATGQTSYGPNPSKNIQGGSTGEGLKLGCTAPVVSTPTYDKASQVAAVTTTAAGTSNTYVCANWPFDRTWPSNLKLTGNVTVDGSCNVKIKGNVYITGDLNIGGASTITVDESAGTTRPVVIVDGKITLGGSARILANSKGTGIQFISFKSAASCGANCTALSGNDLKSSQGLETVNIGGAVNLPGMIFQSYWGKITLGGSGSVGSIIGQTIDMSGAGTVTFGTTLSSGSKTWTVTSYQRLKPGQN